MSKTKYKQRTLTFPEDEAKYPWLRNLLKAYDIIDKDSHKGIKKEESKRGIKLACKKGCFICCLNPVVPMSKWESAGISWFISEKLMGANREIVKHQLLNHRESTICPFLVDTICSIYPVRPIACRQYFVIGTPCLENDNVMLTRPNDIWAPGGDTSIKVMMNIMPLYGVNDKRMILLALEEGFLVDNSKPMHELDLEILVNNMNTYDS